MERTVATSRGSEANFASQEEVVEKFEKLARENISGERMRKLEDTVFNLEKLGDAAELSQLLASN